MFIQPLKARQQKQNQKYKLSAQQDVKSNSQKFTWVNYKAIASTTEHYGTSLQQLSSAAKHSSPLRGWQSARFAQFPQSIVIHLDNRCQIAHVLVRSKQHLPIPSVQVHIGDGIGTSFVDSKYRMAGSIRGINQGQSAQIDCIGIGSFVKLVFDKAPQRNSSNPNGQVGLQSLRVWARPLSFGGLGISNQAPPLVNNSGAQIGKNHQSQIDSILLQLGVPLGVTDWDVGTDDFKYAPVDDETRNLLMQLQHRRQQALKMGDYTQASQLRSDLKLVVEIGQKILGLKRLLGQALSVQNYDEAIRIKPQIEQWSKKRQIFEAMYETDAFQEGIVMNDDNFQDSKAMAFTQQIVQQKKNKIQQLPFQNDDQRKIQPQKKTVSFQDEKLRQEKSIDNEENSKILEFDFKQPRKKSKINQSVVSSKKKKSIIEADKSLHSDVIKGEPLKFNQGDQELEPFFMPLIREAGGSLTQIEQDQLKRAFSRGVLTVTGARLWNALHSETWRHREASVGAFYNYITQDPLSMKWEQSTLALFDGCIEVAHVAFDDKLQQIFLKSLQILKTAFSPPIISNDISFKHRNSAIRRFTPLLVHKICELNYRSRDASLAALMQIYQAQGAEFRILIQNIMDITETEEVQRYDNILKKPQRIVHGRLQVLLALIHQFGVDDEVWNWRVVLEKLIGPSLLHSAPDVRLVAIDIITGGLYKFKGIEVLKQLEKIEGLRPNIKQTINKKIEGAVGFRGGQQLQSVQQLPHQNLPSSHQAKRQSSPFVNQKQGTGSGFKGSSSTTSKFLKTPSPSGSSKKVAQLKKQNLDKQKEEWNKRLQEELKQKQQEEKKEEEKRQREQELKLEEQQQAKGKKGKNKKSKSPPPNKKKK